MKIFQLLVISFFFYWEINGAKRTFDDVQSWRVFIENEEDKEVIQSHIKDRRNILKEMRTQIDILVNSSMIDELTESLENADVKYEVLNENYQSMIDRETLTANKIRTSFKAKKEGRADMNWSNYQSADTIFKYLDSLATTYSQRCSVKTIGTTYEGRPIKLMKISDGNPSNKAFWIDGGIHAREWISPASVTFIIKELCENWNSQPAHVRKINYHIVALANPDGYEYSRTNDRLWRKNRRKPTAADMTSCFGVDLNRNFDYKFGVAGTENKFCSEIYLGKAAFTEPETKAIRDYMQSMNYNFIASTSFHSYGQHILTPWGWTDKDCDDCAKSIQAGNLAAENIRKATGAIYSVENSGKGLYFAGGCSDDFAKSKKVKYVYTVELRDTGKEGFVLSAKYIADVGKDAFVFTSSLAQFISVNEKK